MVLIRPVRNTIYEVSDSVAAPRGGGTGGIRPPNSQKSAKTVNEKWHKISWVFV